MKIKHDFVHSNDPKTQQEETWAEAILAGLAFMSCIFLTCTYIYILVGL